MSDGLACCAFCGKVVEVIRVVLDIRHRGGRVYCSAECETADRSGLGEDLAIMLAAPRPR